MAVYRNRVREAAERLVKLRDYLYTNASPTHAVKARDMLAYLEGIDHKVEIKTLYSDINILTAYFGLDIQYDGRQKGYTLNNPQFEPYELRMIVNSIQAAKFITQQEADRLTAKIMSELADKYTRPSLKRKTYIPNRVRAINEELMKGLDIIYEAIAQDKKISFKYFEYTINEHIKTKQYRSVLDSKIITASPYSIVWASNKFWIDVILKIPKDIWYISGLEYSEEEGKYIDTNGELIEEGESIDFWCNAMDDTGLYVYQCERLALELMEQIKILTEKREGIATIQGMTDDSDIEILFRTIKLKVDKWDVSEVIKKFENDVSISPDGSTSFIATIHEELTPELYMWTREFSPPIEIIYPENAEEKFKRYFLSISKGERPDDCFYRDGFTFPFGDELFEK